ncbi:hypothetical protein OfM1_20560 [Lactovum odontotermitis]
MVQQMLDSGGYERVTVKVGTVTSEVAGVRNGLSTNDAHLKVTTVPKIFEIYDELTQLVSAYGVMAQKDLEEFRQLAVNIINTDEEAS